MRNTIAINRHYCVYIAAITERLARWWWMKMFTGVFVVYLYIYIVRCIVYVCLKFWLCVCMNVFYYFCTTLYYAQTAPTWLTIGTFTRRVFGVNAWKYGPRRNATDFTKKNVRNRWLCRDSNLLNCTMMLVMLMMMMLLLMKSVDADRNADPLQMMMSSGPLESYAPSLINSMSWSLQFRILLNDNDDRWWRWWWLQIEVSFCLIAQIFCVLPKDSMLLTVFFFSIAKQTKNHFLINFSLNLIWIQFSLA